MRAPKPFRIIGESKVSQVSKRGESDALAELGWAFGPGRLDELRPLIEKTGSRRRIAARLWMCRPVTRLEEPPWSGARQFGGARCKE